MKKIFVYCVVAVVITISMCGCHSHEYSEASCTQPKTCIVCGEIEGEPLPHLYSDATCTQPKVCTVCGATDGDAIGHSVSLGVCSQCNEFINEQVIYELTEIIQEAGNSESVAQKYVSQANSASDLKSMYRFYCSAVDYYEKSQSKLREAANMCKEYPELKDLQKKLEAVVYYNLSKPASATALDLADFIDRLVDYSYLSQEYAYEMLDIVESIPD